MSSEYLTAHRRFETDGMPESAEVEARKAALEAEAELELYDRLGNTLADFQIWPTWTQETANDCGVRTYSLTAKVVFKP